jgi:hypothetical protein
VLALGLYEARLPAGRGEFPALVVFTTMGMPAGLGLRFVTLFVALEVVTSRLPAGRLAQPAALHRGGHQVRDHGALAAPSWSTASPDLRATGTRLRVVQTACCANPPAALAR